MFKFKYAAWIALSMACLASAPSLATLSDPPAGTAIPQPRQELLPQDVVKIVITALAHNDEPYADAGIATTFAFASPANRVNTGPLEKFTAMVKSPVYGIMLNHVEHSFSEVVLVEATAYQMVQLTGRDGRRTVFAFRLGKQLDGKFAGMWMTDAVWPVKVADFPEQAF
jgi:hypothetical protein